MADETKGAATATGEAPVEPGTPPVVESPTQASRIAGLDAKVTELKLAAKAEKTAREAAETKLAEYEAGKVNADEALRAQLLAKDTEIAKRDREIALTRIEAKYPETFKVLGENAATLTVDQLADAEARFQGTPAGEAPSPKPVPNNQGRAESTPGPQESSFEDEFRVLAGLALPEYLRGPGS